MTTTTPDDLFTQPRTDAPTGIERDRWDRPLILQPDGSKKGYVRVSTLAKALDDATALGDWKARNVAKAVATNADLAQSFAVLDVNAVDEDGRPGEDKKRAAELVSMAMEREKTSAKRESGTAFHKVIELRAQGQEVAIHPTLEPAVADWDRKTAGIRWLGFEKFVVNDRIQSAGTADLFGWREGWKLPRIMDIKTGRVDYSQVSFAMQLAVYAEGKVYDPTTGERSDLPWPVDQEVGHIIHVNIPDGIVTFYDVDLVRGRSAIAAALVARLIRKESRKYMTKSSDTIARLFAAKTLQQLNEIYAETKPWNEHEQKAASLRAEELRAVAS